MKTSKFKAVLPLANKLQSLYDAMKVAPTQNVRNPLPMNTLVEMALPVISPDVGYIIEGKLIRTTILGKRIMVKPTAWVMTSDVLGKDYIVKSARSVDDIISKLTSAGYLVKSRQSVLTALCNNPKVQRIPATAEMVEKRKTLVARSGNCSYMWTSKRKDGTDATPQGCFAYNLYYIRQD